MLYAVEGSSWVAIKDAKVDVCIETVVGLTSVLVIYCYENGNRVLKIINKSSKNKNNNLVYVINQ